MRDRLIELLKMRQDNGEKWHYSDCGQGREMVTNERLADYLLENGVIVPPCKVGDTIYVIACSPLTKQNYILKQKVAGFTTEKGLLYLYFDDAIGGLTLVLFAKTAFLTREDAERALKGGIKND